MKEGEFSRPREHKIADMDFSLKFLIFMNEEYFKTLSTNAKRKNDDAALKAYQWRKGLRKGWVLPPKMVQLYPNTTERMIKKGS